MSSPRLELVLVLVNSAGTHRYHWDGVGPITHTLSTGTSDTIMNRDPPDLMSDIFWAWVLEYAATNQPIRLI